MSPKKRAKSNKQPGKKQDKRSFDKAYHGHRAKLGDRTLKSWSVGPLPIVNRILQRMRLDELLEKHLPADDSRMKVATKQGLLLLIRNILLSREPIYGLGQWAELYAPDLLGLQERDLKHLNDDRIGRCLDRLFDAGPQWILDVVRQVIDEFDLQLDELHNDSTSIAFHGSYDDAATEARRRGRDTLAITFGHSKDRRPDLKQLLYILTITDDGGVPVYFTAASGNVPDDNTHLATWEILCELVGRPDFLYVADSKLASSENLKTIHSRGGRFITVLPRTRKEDKEFRGRLFESAAASTTSENSARWDLVYDITNSKKYVVDRLRVWRDGMVSQEGFRLLWFHSSRKAAHDASVRARSIDRVTKQLTQLRERLQSPRSRFRERSKVEEAVENIRATEGGQWVHVEIERHDKETLKQVTRGRAGKETQFVKKITTRFTLSYQVDHAQVAEDEAADGVFPLITNDTKMTAEEVLRAYKRQPLIEKRFSQFKTDFQVAPVYLKEVSRIQALLGVYFLVLMVQTLMERELRRAMAAAEIESLPMYPEGRDCSAPSARRLLDIFEPVQRHCLGGEEPIECVTQLTPLQRELLRLLGHTPRDYGRR
jgi:transposase